MIFVTTNSSEIIASVRKHNVAAYFRNSIFISIRHTPSLWQVFGVVLEIFEILGRPNQLANITNCSLSKDPSRQEF